MVDFSTWNWTYKCKVFRMFLKKILGSVFKFEQALNYHIQISTRSRKCHIQNWDHVFSNTVFSHLRIKTVQWPWYIKFLPSVLPVFGIKIFKILAQGETVSDSHSLPIATWGPYSLLHWIVSGYLPVRLPSELYPTQQWL